LAKKIARRKSEQSSVVNSSSCYELPGDASLVLSTPLMRNKVVKLIARDGESCRVGRFGGIAQPVNRHCEINCTLPLALDLRASPLSDDRIGRPKRLALSGGHDRGRAQRRRGIEDVRLLYSCSGVPTLTSACRTSPIRDKAVAKTVRLASQRDKAELRIANRKSHQGCCN